MAPSSSSSDDSSVSSISGPFTALERQTPASEREKLKRTQDIIYEWPEASAQRQVSAAEIPADDHDTTKAGEQDAAGGEENGYGAVSENDANVADAKSQDWADLIAPHLIFAGVAWLLFRVRDLAVNQD